MLAAAVSISSCGTSASHETPAEDLLSKLAETVAEGRIMYGHQDDLMYGHSWRSGAEETAFNRSDVKEVCGSYPAVYGLDLGGIELASPANLDGNHFVQMRASAVLHHERGGVVTFSWHPRNPLTGGDSWDISSDKVVESVLEGGERHDEFMLWLSHAADFLASLKTSDGKPIPVIFRPWHEHLGSWFWWGRDLCSAEQYKALWIMTYEYMVSQRGLDNLLWCYSPNSGISSEEYMSRYPGDEYVDMLGLDCYEYRADPSSDDYSADNALYAAQVRDALEYMSRIGREHGKLIALTETGFEGIPYPLWWTEVLYPAIKDFQIAYVLTWRNAHDMPGHYYAPFPGSGSAEDFREFAGKDKMLFCKM